MFPLNFLGMVLVACVYTAEARQPSSNPRGACEVAVDRSRYNLCPLFDDQGRPGVVQVRAELSPTTQIHYEISFNGPLNTPEGEEDVEPQVRKRLLLHFGNEESAYGCFSALQVHGFVCEVRTATVYRQQLDITFLLPECQTQSGDSESHITQAIPIAGDFSIGASQGTKSSRPEVYAYHNTENGQFWRSSRL